MQNRGPLDIRATILEVIREQSPKSRSDSSLQSGPVLRQVAQKIGASGNTEMEQTLLSELQALFRTGYLAWGVDLSNADAPHFHVTTTGTVLLQKLTRDPGNRAGYRAHLSSIATISAIANSYLEESLDCYAVALYKAAAVMLGAAAESLVIDLRDTVVDRLTSLSKAAPKDLSDWRLKRILDALHGFFSANRSELPPALRDEFEAYWSAFTQQIRAVRNEVGHPSSVTPVTSDTVHASLLIFPELAKLQTKLKDWTINTLNS